MIICQEKVAMPFPRDVERVHSKYKVWAYVVKVGHHTGIPGEHT